MTRFVLALLLTLAVFAGNANAQVLPAFADPSAREDIPDLTAVPALRFLTSTGYPPFNYRDNGGQLVGFNVDLARAICETLDISCTIQAWPWEQAADALADNQGDALIDGLAIGPATAARFDFSDVYLRLPARFVFPKASTAAFGARHLAGLKLAVRRNTAHARFLSAFLPDVEQLPYDTEFDALAAVRDGTADGYFGDALRASFWLNDNPGCCAFAGEAYFDPDYFGEGLAVAIPAGHGAIRAAVNYALGKLQRSGKYEEIYLRWFPVSFY